MTQDTPLVLIPGKIHPRVVERLKAAHTVLQVPVEEVASLDEATRRRIRAMAFSYGGGKSGELIAALPALEIIANFGVGYDGVDVKAAAERGIIVTNTPDVLDDEVADTTIALLLNTARQFYQAESWLRAGHWQAEGPFALSPLSLRGRHVGLYGLGRIGREIASRLEPFKVKISYHTRTPRQDVSYGYAPSLLELARTVDTLICIVPKTPETHKAINAEVLQALGPKGIFISVGRGWSVDEEALISALKTGTIAGAGLDVFYSEPHVPAELLTFPNVSLLPHVASASVDTRNAMADLVVDNILGWLENRKALTPVPETPAR
ncbi:2-hydroxyacid dehydrogenase [Rhizobium paknamense]|uniref:Lactate dehydrogenase-like 2-hydroxyacid dehydrogenase n=1 Tax=Rhizobium paknamense TaxID=1206817 RepID=A0ABU0IDB1_9HYPH|nr:2-hydroxyacid dehydrogenase [Rhizobium paknamense]MDQ0456238.1 lactate dehydrogenase-like 2-hydroxyacid dehydrogenase [Rhizobium paknamense]